MRAELYAEGPLRLSVAPRPANASDLPNPAAEVVVPVARGAQPAPPVRLLLVVDERALVSWSMVQCPQPAAEPCVAAW